MKKKELEEKSGNRLKALKSLYNDTLYDEVISDCGLVIELALKAAICKTINKDLYPETIKKYRSHDAEKLIILAKLEQQLEIEKNNSIEFFINWSLLSKWSINFRYQPPGTFDKVNAENHIKAIESQQGGVYPWIKKSW